MKTKVLLAFILLMTIATMMHIKEQHYMDQTQKQMHLQVPIPGLDKAVQVATQETMKKILDDPQNAAKIPTKLLVGRIDSLIQTFTGAWSLKDRSRSLQLTFVNYAGADVELEQTYFDSGTWFNTWQNPLKSGFVNQGTVANRHRQGSFFTGVTGGFRLRIKGGPFVYIGFKSPYIGSFKNFAEINWAYKSAKYGYDQSKNNDPTVSRNSGYKITKNMVDSSIAQKAFVYILTKE